MVASCTAEEVPKLESEIGLGKYQPVLPQSKDGQVHDTDHADEDRLSLELLTSVEHAQATRDACEQ